MKNTGVKTRITSEKIFSLLLDMDERVTNMGEQIVEIKDTMATKDDLESLREDVLKEIRPLHRAVDKDAKTIMNHEKRIAVLEKRVVV